MHASYTTPELQNWQDPCPEAHSGHFPAPKLRARPKCLPATLLPRSGFLKKETRTSTSERKPLVLSSSFRFRLISTDQFQEAHLASLCTMADHFCAPLEYLSLHFLLKAKNIILTADPSTPKVLCVSYYCLSPGGLESVWHS